MPHNSRKRPAASTNSVASEVVSPSGVEVLSVDSFNGKVIKKHAVEKGVFMIPLNDVDNTSLPPDDMEDATPTVENPKGLSRSASVSTFSYSAYII